MAKSDAAQQPEVQISTAFQMSKQVVEEPISDDLQTTTVMKEEDFKIMNASQNQSCQPIGNFAKESEPSVANLTRVSKKKEAEEAHREVMAVKKEVPVARKDEPADEQATVLRTVQKKEPEQKP